MIDETLQDQAALYVMRMLPPQEALQFVQAMDQSDELRSYVAELEETAAELAHAAPVVAPPLDLKSKVMAEFRREQALMNDAPRTGWTTWVPWAATACAVITAGTIAFENSSLRYTTNELALQMARQNQTAGGLRQAIAELKQRDTLATTQIATLSAKVSAYEKALAVVVYDPDHQTGLVKLDKFPAAAPGKDYQLWVIEPGGAAPVSAGVVRVPQGGVTQAAFRPTRKVKGVDAFAISVEQTGGSPSPKGDIVFVGK